MQPARMSTCLWLVVYREWVRGCDDVDAERTMGAYKGAVEFTIFQNPIFTYIFVPASAPALAPVSLPSPFPLVAA
jgi:hypothetical protein